MSVSVDGYRAIVSRFRLVVPDTARQMGPTIRSVWLPRGSRTSTTIRQCPLFDFFHGGYAIHGSYEIDRLGGPASHGLVRLHPANAASLYDW